MIWRQKKRRRVNQGTRGCATSYVRYIDNQKGKEVKAKLLFAQNMNKKTDDAAYANDNIKILVSSKTREDQGGIHKRKMSPHERVCEKKRWN